MSGAQTISPISETEFCHIDFNRLCDKNDFAALTDNYNSNKTRELLHSIQNEQLRAYVIDAIKLERKMRANDDFDSMLSIEKEQSILQQNCRETYCQNKIQPKADVIDNSESNQKQKCKRVTANQFSIFMYYNGEYNKVVITKENSPLSQDQAKNVYSILSGYSPRSFDDHIIPDIDNKRTLSDMRIVENLIREIAPEVAKLIERDISNAEYSES